jgi:hypothetical protein
MGRLIQTRLARSRSTKAHRAFARIASAADDLADERCRGLRPALQPSSRVLVPQASGGRERVDPTHASIAFLTTREATPLAAGRHSVQVET